MAYIQGSGSGPSPWHEAHSETLPSSTTSGRSVGILRRWGAGKSCGHGYRISEECIHAFPDPLLSSIGRFV